jgi:flavodoxin
MNTVIIFDSLFGNTEKIAHAIGKGISGNVKVIPAEKANFSVLKGINLLIAGSPTHGGKPSPEMQKFLNSIPQRALNNVYIATFDTRFYYQDHGIGLKLLMNILKFAAARIEKQLVKKEGTSVIKPEGFFVEGKEGPLMQGELKRATAWGKTIKKSLTRS